VHLAIFLLFTNNVYKHAYSPTPFLFHDVVFVFSESLQRGGSAEQAVKWRRPDAGTLKVNTDGAFLQGDGLGATGAVFCGSEWQAMPGLGPLD